MDVLIVIRFTYLRSKGYTVALPFSVDELKRNPFVHQSRRVNFVLFLLLGFFFFLWPEFLQNMPHQLDGNCICIVHIAHKTPYVNWNFQRRVQMTR